MTPDTRFPAADAHTRLYGVMGDPVGLPTLRLVRVAVDGDLLAWSPAWAPIDGFTGGFAGLADHPQVHTVHYPGLESHPGHEIARRQMSDFGGMLSIQVRGGPEKAAAVAAGTRIFAQATSLGGVESLIEQPAIISYHDKSPEERAALGIKDNLVRFAIGIEDTEDILNDIEQALRVL